VDAFKRRMMDVGFSLSDYPDEDLLVLDLDNNGSISPSEFMQFVEEGMTHNEATATVPSELTPVDDLLFKRVNLDGVITVKVTSARFLRDVTTWFSAPSRMTESTSEPTCGLCMFYFGDRH